MYTQRWETSRREYGVAVERDVAIAMPDGTHLVGDIFRPDRPGRYPVILGCHPYNNELQTAPIRPIGYGPHRGFLEAGDPEFFVRRGYVHAIFNVRGTGKSQGLYQMMGPREVADVAYLIGVLANMPWSSGRVGMFGVSYFAWLQAQVAAVHPEGLACIFAPFGATDFYRDVFYRGGILNHRFLVHWLHHVDNPRPFNWTRDRLGEQRYRQALAELRDDEDLMGVEAIARAVASPELPRHQLLLDVVLNSLDGDYYRERNVNYQEATVPAVVGGCWGMYGLHLPGGLRSFSQWKGPARLVVGPPLYLDRPVYQYQYYALRWFDTWLKDREVGIGEEPPVQLFIPPTGEWRFAPKWPLEETRWTPFYLHERGLLSEHEFWPGEVPTRYEDSTFLHGEATFWTPPLVEVTEVCGPVAVTLYAATTDRELLLFATLLVRGQDGTEEELTRGWLRASQRLLDPSSPPWAPHLVHSRREMLVPGEVYELKFPLVATARLLRPGEQLGLRIKSADDEPARNRLQQVARGGLWRQTPSRVTIFHDPEHPSELLLPVVRGNLIGTFLSGGVLPNVSPGGEPMGKIDRAKEWRSDQ
ncbi:MAG: CocE/NonD family hydrolase [Firmicutes bacterium]|nr:CocE/NonD family hydrolase [Bacillota bacterium]